jgi:glycosyltransferase involved in cell wall biosynthesis
MLGDYRLQLRRKALLPRYAAIVVASRWMRDEYRRNAGPTTPIHLNPLFAHDESATDEPPSRQRTGRVLFVGRLTKLKGVDYLIPAIEAANDMLDDKLTLVVAGEGPERGRLEALAQVTNIAAEFHGWVDPDRRREIARGADLLAIPSVWPEPFGLAGIEAARLGLPAVGFAHGGIIDWLRPSLTGELAPADPPTVMGLANAITRVLAVPTHYARLALGAWQSAAEFALARHVDQLDALFRSVAPNHRQIGAGA